MKLNCCWRKHRYTTNFLFAHRSMLWLTGHPPPCLIHTCVHTRTHRHTHHLHDTKQSVLISIPWVVDLILFVTMGWGGNFSSSLPLTLIVRLITAMLFWFKTKRLKFYLRKTLALTYSVRNILLVCFMHCSCTTCKLYGGVLPDSCSAQKPPASVKRNRLL